MSKSFRRDCDCKERDEVVILLHPSFIFFRWRESERAIIGNGVLRWARGTAINESEETMASK
jgi:hypothetical protein